jgi:hypothetical protein
VFEITRDDASAHVLVDGGIVGFVGCGETCAGTVETIRIVCCMDVSGANSFLKIDDILLQKTALED